MDVLFTNVEQLIAATKEWNLPLSEVMIRQEQMLTRQPRQKIIDHMRDSLHVMRDAVERGLEGVTSTTGLTGGDAVLMEQYIRSGRTLSGDVLLQSVSRAIATNEVNAAMGLICATPTAGAAGIVPGVLFAAEQKLQPTEEQMINFLFTSGAFGFVVANNASISGAAGGCQAETGSAASMAAAALVEMAGGTPEQSAEAFSIVMKNMLGLVCDPVAGLVEVPCVKRNAMGAGKAFIGADMALAGIKSRIPTDEVIAAMHAIGQSMHPDLKETARGGLATTPTGQRYMAEIFGE